MVDGIECDAPLHARGLIAETGGHPRMAALVEAERKDQQHKLKEGDGERCGLHGHSPGVNETSG